MQRCLGTVHSMYIRTYLPYREGKETTLQNDFNDILAILYAVGP